MPDEIFIERRPNRISIQRDGIGNDETETRELLQAALDALNSDRQRENWGGEIVIHDEKKDDDE